MIEILLPGADTERVSRRRDLICRAQKAIARDESASVLRTGTLAAFFEHLRGGGVPDADRERICAALASETVYLERLEKNSPGPLRDPAALVQSASRCAVVLSDVLDGIARSGPRVTHDGLARITSVLARFSQVVLALVRVSTPGNILAHPFRRLVMLLTVAAVTIIIAAPVVNPQLLPLGVWVLAALLVVVAIVTILSSIMRGRYALLRTSLAAGLLMVVALAVVGGFHMLEALARLTPTVEVKMGLQPASQ